MTITLYKKDSASGTVYDSSVIESLSVTQNADIMADIVPIDTAICRIRSETPLVAEYMDVDDNTGITGRPLSPLVAPIGHYVVKQINNLGNNLYEIQGYSLVYRLDTPKVPAKYYNGVSLSVALKDVEKNANGSFGVTYNVDTALSGKTITGYCPEQTARERLQQFCWAVGGYVSCACSALINILAIPSTVQGTVPKSKIYAFPAVANEDEVARVNLTVHTYTAGTSGDDIVIDADGNKYVHTTSTLTMANTALTGVSNREISVDNATLVNSSNAQATLLRMASVYFNSGTWYGTTTPQGYIPGQMVQAEDRDGQLRQGYISALTYSFGKGAATTMELKQSVSIAGLPAPVLSVTSTNETLWITSSDDRVTSFMLYDNDTLIHTFTQLSTPTASITNGTMSWNSITNADGYIVNAVKDGAEQSKSVTETSINLSAWLTEAGTYSLTVKASGYGYIMSEESAAVAYTIQNKLATPTIAMNADGKTLEITDVANATSYDVYVDGTLKTNVASVPNTTTFDLSTLPDITDGTHTVKVKAKANGYNDSEFSNEVSYTKAPAGYKVTFASDFSSIAYSGGEISGVTLTANTGESTPLTSAARGLVWQGVSTLAASEAISGSISYIDASGAKGGFYQYLTLTSDITITYADDTCLTGDMLITLADGTTKRIDTITLADRVLAYNPETMALEADEIIRCDSDKIKTHSEYDIWTFDDDTVVKTVHRHRLYNAEKQAMVYMDEWNVGDHAVKIDGTKVALVNHVNVQEEVRHYTIFTNHQNYFVNGLLSGNRYTKRLFVDV